MSAQHKAAIAAGREEARAVRKYLEALDSYHPRRGPQPRPENVAQQIDDIDSELAVAAPARRVQLVHERMRLYAQLKSLEAAAELDSLEDGFVQAAGPYSARKGLSYSAWRQVGVSARVLKRAGIKETRL